MPDESVLKGNGLQGGFDEAVTGIYEAAMDPKRWEEALWAIAHYVDGGSAVLGINDPLQQRCDLMVHAGIDPRLIAVWHRDYDQEDPWAKGALGLDEGAVVTGSQIVSLEELQRLRVYRELLVENGVHDVISGVLAKRGERTAFVTVHRGRERPLFGASEMERLARLVPHLQRAAAIRARLAEAEGRFLVEAAVLDRVQVALVVCDAEARLLRTNRRAEGLLRDGRLLRRRGARLACRRASQERRLRALLARAAGAEEGRPAACGALPLTLEGERPGVGALVAPLAPREAERGLVRPGSPAALVVVTEPDAPVRVPEGLLRDLYALTPAEARLAAALASGRTLQEHAADAGIAVGTARWRLKQVFAKTETRRQAELAGLVLRSVALVDPGA